LPLTPNGKVDRKALPVPDMARTQEGYVAPRTSVEEGLAKIICDVLSLEKVGIHDDFFHLGANSLSLMQIISKIQVFFDVKINILQGYSSPNIAALAEGIELAVQKEQMERLKSEDIFSEIQDLLSHNQE
jgi:acyl carrier protein